MLRILMPSVTIATTLFGLACRDAPEIPEVSSDRDSGPLLEFKDGQLKIRAPGVNIDFDGNSGEARVDIDTNGVRVYADETGHVEIDAPGVRVEQNGESQGAAAGGSDEQRDKTSKSAR